MSIYNKWPLLVRTFVRASSSEFRVVSSRYPILLVLLGGIFLYGFLYNYMYAPNVVREAPVVVVDQSHTARSRTFIRLLDATPQVQVVAEATDEREAKAWMCRGEVDGICYIPADFEQRLMRGEEALFVAYQTTRAFLSYMALQEGITGAMLSLNERCRLELLCFMSPAEASQLVASPSISVVGMPLFNPTEGYATYLIPAVLIVILFQTLLMVIGMSSGEERSEGSLAKWAVGGLSWSKVVGIVLGKTFVYLLLYLVFSLFLLGLIPQIFGLPNGGRGVEVICLLIPFLLSTSFLGLSASCLFSDAESPLLMIAFFSVGLLFLSGVSYPLELMPLYWRVAHYLLPAPPATLGYVQLRSMGASLAQVKGIYLTLWIQVAAFFVIACWVYRQNILKSLKDDQRNFSR